MNEIDNSLLLEFIKLRENHIEDNIQKVYTRIGILLTMISIMISIFIIGLERSLETIVIFSSSFISLLITGITAICILYPFKMDSNQSKPDLRYDLKVEDLMVFEEGRVILKRVTLEDFAAKAIKHEIHAKKRIRGLKYLIVMNVFLFGNIISDSIIYLSGFTSLIEIIIIQITLNILIAGILTLKFKKQSFINALQTIGKIITLQKKRDKRKN